MKKKLVIGIVVMLLLLTQVICFAGDNDVPRPCEVENAGE